MNSDLIRKYNQPVPRYTSYPTVPYWDDAPITEKQWIERVKNAFNRCNYSDGMSIYIHLPFCERLCTFCACNKRITVNHAVEEPYVKCVLREWEMYKKIFEGVPLIRELHLGGGTPTFFSSARLEQLIRGIFKGSRLHPEVEMGVEVHPNVTSAEQLKTLYGLGFRRLSMGVQDFDSAVQKVINRMQTYEQTAAVIETARKIGYTSINIDLIYGLPLQTRASIEDTIQKINSLLPERIAFYSYAHVPWKSPGQRRYTEADLPTAKEKRTLYELGRALLEEIGYKEIGMDHFALPQDALYRAAQVGTLHRNFMGYTIGYTELLIGLGVSSISDTWDAFMQNEKEVETYSAVVQEERLPILRGHLLNEEDLILRKHILNLMCRFQTSWEQPQLFHPSLTEGVLRMKELEKDGLVILQNHAIYVTEIGRAFIRNICAALDARLWRKPMKTKLFSQAI